MTVQWLDAPEDHDYGAAAQYLSLLDNPYNGCIDAFIKSLRSAPESQYYAKDILRASQLSLLPTDNAHVAKDLNKIHHGKPLSPVLLIRGRPLIIADGYHRVCASYHVDENSPVSCRIV